MKVLSKETNEIRIEMTFNQFSNLANILKANFKTCFKHIQIFQINGKNEFTFYISINVDKYQAMMFIEYIKHYVEKF